MLRPRPDPGQNVRFHRAPGEGGVPPHIWVPGATPQMRLLGHPTNPQEPPTAWGAGVPRLPAGERGKRKAVNQQREPTLHLRPATPGRAERGRVPSTLTENAAGHDSRSPQTGGAGRQARAVKRRVPGTWDTERLASASGAAGGRPTRGEPGCFGGDNRAPEAGPSWGAPLGQKRGPGPGHTEAPRAWPGPGTWSGARSGPGGGGRGVRAGSGSALPAPECVRHPTPSGE